MQAALQAYADATSNVRAGTAIVKQFCHAGSILDISFNSACTHLAAIQGYSVVKIFETASMCCVCRLDRLGSKGWYTGLHWGPNGTDFALMERQRDTDMPKVYLGNLVQAMHHEHPFESLKCATLGFSKEKFGRRRSSWMSPDLSKLCLVYERVGPGYELPADYELVAVSIFSTADGAKIWERNFNDGPTRVFYSMVWHTHSDTFFFSIHLKGLPWAAGPPGEVWAVTLSADLACKCDFGQCFSGTSDLRHTWHALGLSVSPHGSWLTANLVIAMDSVQDTALTQQTLLHWPLQDAFCQVDDLFHNELFWDWDGNRFACLTKAQGQGLNAALCVGKPGTHSGAALAAGAKWVPAACCHFDSFLTEPGWYHSQNVTCLRNEDLSVAWSPGDLLAFSLKRQLFQGTVFLFDTMQPDLHLVSKFHLGHGIDVSSLQWAPDSAMLFITIKLFGHEPGPSYSVCVLGDQVQLLDFSGPSLKHLKA